MHLLQQHDQRNVVIAVEGSVLEEGEIDDTTQSPRGRRPRRSGDRDEGYSEYDDTMSERSGHHRRPRRQEQDHSRPRSSSRRYDDERRDRDRYRERDSRDDYERRRSGDRRPLEEW